MSTTPVSLPVATPTDSAPAQSAPQQPQPKADQSTSSSWWSNLADPQKVVDSLEEKAGNAIDSWKQGAEQKVDQFRDSLSKQGVVGKAASAYLGLQEGATSAVYDTAKGAVQLANGASKLASPSEWASNPQANVDRLKTAGSAAWNLTKLTTPIGDMVDPQGKQAAYKAIGDSVVDAFKKDPAKATGYAAGTIATFLVPGAGEAGAATDASRAAGVANDVNHVVQAANAADHAGQVANAADHAGQVANTADHAAEAANAAKDTKAIPPAPPEGPPPPPPTGQAFRKDLPAHLAGPDGFTKSGQLSGTHNLDNAVAALKSKNATYTVTPTSTPGIGELKYRYTDPATGKVVSGSKTVYDPKVISDTSMLHSAQQAGEQAWQMYQKDPSQKVFDVTQNGVKFRVYINYTDTGAPYIGNVHPIK